MDPIGGCSGLIPRKVPWRLHSCIHLPIPHPALQSATACMGMYASVDSMAWPLGARRRSDRASLLRSQRRQGRRARGCFVPLQPIGFTGKPPRSARARDMVPGACRRRPAPRLVTCTSLPQVKNLAGTGTRTTGRRRARVRARFYIHIQVVKWNSSFV